MLTQGVIEQSPLTPTARRNSLASSDRVLETNIENLLRMVLNKLSAFLVASWKQDTMLTFIPQLQVSYCENDVDCRRLLQLMHLGEKFDPINCKRTCDNCSKMLTWVDKDVTDIAIQLVRNCFFLK